MTGRNALVIGATRGLGQGLVKELLERGYSVYATARTSDTSRAKSQICDGISSAGSDKLTVWTGIDLGQPTCGTKLGQHLKEAGPETKFDLVIYSAGYFKPDALDTLDWEEHRKMYDVCAIAPAFIASALVANDAFVSTGSAKFLLVTTEGGSIALRTADEGGGNYGHHASKAASNMIGKLLSIDLAKKGVTTVNIHPGFMRTDGTKGMGFESAWDEGGAVSPEEGAKSLVDFAEKVDDSKRGQLWAPRGPRDIGQAENVMGKDLPTPLQLPW